MEEIVICDTNILIELYRNNRDVRQELMQIGQNRLAVSAISAGELIFGARNKAELQQIVADLASIKIFSLDERITQQSLELMKSFSLSHRLSLPDALIAATALAKNLPFYTLNTKDFKYLPGIRLWNNT
ncbi:MAG: type II toxin-antitoxin system VapC family toxin [Bacteroidia bacterium]|nr:type II toxin-antitoxin system VapC family toxin [Bacteroidia bacterium]